MKVRRKRKVKNRVSPYGRSKDNVSMETDIEIKAEKRGDIEKRHHTERKNLKKEEQLLRQKMRKLNKRNPEQAKERKALLLKIKNLAKDLAERQNGELEKFTAAKKNSEPKSEVDTEPQNSRNVADVMETEATNSAK